MSGRRLDPSHTPRTTTSRPLPTRLNTHSAPIRTEEIWWHLIRAAHREAHRVGLRPEDAEDCAASFASHAIGRREQIVRRDLPPEQAEAWLLRCALNWCRNFAKSVRRRSTVPLETDTAPGPTKQVAGIRPDPCASSALRSEVAQRVDEALTVLAPEKYRIFVSHCMEGKSLQQIATDLAASPGSVRVNLFRARRQLQDRLRQRGINDHYLR